MMPQLGAAPWGRCGGLNDEFILWETALLSVQRPTGLLTDSFLPQLGGASRSLDGGRKDEFMLLQTTPFSVQRPTRLMTDSQACLGSVLQTSLPPEQNSARARVCVHFGDAGRGEGINDVDSDVSVELTTCPSSERKGDMLNCLGDRDLPQTFVSSLSFGDTARFVDGAVKLLPALLAPLPCKTGIAQRSPR